MFRLGKILATPAALEAINSADQSPIEFLARHHAHDWGEVCEEDESLNDQALLDGSRILSAYHTKLGAKIWVITEAANEEGHREATTLLLPQEY